MNFTGRLNCVVIRPDKTCGSETRRLFLSHPTGLDVWPPRLTSGSKKEQTENTEEGKCWASLPGSVKQAHKQDASIDRKDKDENKECSVGRQYKLHREMQQNHLGRVISSGKASREHTHPSWMCRALDYPNPQPWLNHREKHGKPPNESRRPTT